MTAWGQWMRGSCQPQVSTPPLLLKLSLTTRSHFFFNVFDPKGPLPNSYITYCLHLTLGNIYLMLGAVLGWICRGQTAIAIAVPEVTGESSPPQHQQGSKGARTEPREKLDRVPL